MKNKIRHPLFGVWAAMKRRCYNHNCIEYKWYGSRGITVCEEWKSLKGFINDMESSYKKGLTLDRIDNNKGYYKNNCRWATSKDQAINRRNTRFILFNGMRKTLTDWADFLQVNRSTLAQRFYVYHWSIDKVLQGGQIG